MRIDQHFDVRFFGKPETVFGQRTVFGNTNVFQKRMIKRIDRCQNMLGSFRKLIRTIIALALRPQINDAAQPIFSKFSEIGCAQIRHAAAPQCLVPLRRMAVKRLIATKLAEINAAFQI